MKTSIFILCAALLGATSAAARIGETPEEISARYGPPLKQHGYVEVGLFVPSKTAQEEVHEKAGIYVEVLYVNGHCGWIKYSKKVTQHDAAPEFTLEEAAVLQSKCAPNAGELVAKDRLVGKSTDVFLFSTPDGSLTVRAPSTDGQHFLDLEVYTSEWWKATYEKEEVPPKAQEAQRLTDAKGLLSGF